MMHDMPDDPSASRRGDRPIAQAAPSSVPFGLWAADRRGRITYVGGAMLELLGTTLAEFAQGGWAGVVSPGEAKRVETEWRRAVRQGTDWECELPLQTRSGASLVLFCRGVPVRDAEGCVTSWVGVHLDAGEREGAGLVPRELLVALEMERAQLQLMLDNADASLAYLDSEFKIIVFNSGFENAVGVSRQELWARPFFELFPDSDLRLLFERVRDGAEPERCTGCRLRQRTDPATREAYWDISVAPLVDAAGSTVALIVSAIEVSERVLGERLAEARERVNRALAAEFDEGNILVNLLSEAIDALRADSGTVSVLRHGALHRVCSRGLPPGSLETDATVLSLGDTPLVRQTLQDRRPVWADATAIRANALSVVAGDPATRCCLVLPLVQTGRPLGAVFLSYHADRALLPQEMAFADKIAAATSIAMVNVRLYQEQRRIATTLQEGFLHPLPSIPGLELGSAARRAYEPDLIGGDFADVFRLPDGRVLATIGDVSGHGVRAATLGDAVRNGMRALTLAGLSPRTTLATMNELLMLEEGDERLVTVLLLLLDVDSREMTYCSAGHLPPVRIEPNRLGYLQTAQGFPLGSFTGPYEESRISLGRNDALVLATDGIIEARKSGEYFGERRLLAAVRRLRTASAGSIAVGVRDAATQFAGELTDDAQVLVLRLGSPT
jgi:PAS domain S-box-containing protein